MKIAYEHIIRNITQKPEICVLSEKLFQLGHEHEIEEGIFNFEFTPNRGDCLSLKGLLRDLSLFYDTCSEIEIYENDIESLNFKFTNNASRACPKISFLKIDIESVPKNYNKLLEKYFLDLGINKNNFFTDVSNYLSYETGQPTHCYQSSPLESGIKLDFLNESKEFKTLLGKTIEIKKDDLVFQNNENEIINLAGVVGGSSTSCNKNTKSVIVEIAYFNPEVIMGKAVQYAINSEAAHKFERNVDPNSHEYVIRRFIKIVEEHTNILNLEYCSYDYHSQKDKHIHLNLRKINKIIGIELSLEDCSNYLQSLGFSVDEMNIGIPSYRHDINTVNDIAEEVARAIGYNNIKPKKFITTFSSRNQNMTEVDEIKIKNLLINNGFYEVINNPFTQENTKFSFEVDNPIDSNKKYLRTDLKKSLLNNLIYNERRQHESIKLFEIADINTLPSDYDKRVIGIIVSGRVDNNYRDFRKKLDEKYLTDLLDRHIEKSNHKYEIINRDGLNTKSKNIIVYVEIEIDKNFKLNYHNELHNIEIENLTTSYIPVSDYPSSSRDLSFSVKDFSKFKLLQEYLLNYEHDLLKEVFIFDYFFNEKKAEIKIGFRFIFQSSMNTLIDKKVNEAMNPIMSYTTSIEGITIPGMAKK